MRAGRAHHAACGRMAHHAACGRDRTRGTALPMLCHRGPYVEGAVAGSVGETLPARRGPFCCAMH